MNYNHYRSPFAPRLHFDEAGAGAGAGAADGGAGAGSGAGAAKPWHDGLDSTVRGHIDNKGWKVDDPKALVTEMAKAWKGLEQHFGAPADRIVRLPEKADDEAGWSAVRQRMGMPKEAKEYDFTGVKRANGADVDAALADSVRSALHKAGTPKDAAPEVLKSVVKVLDDEAAAKATERATRNAAEKTALQSEWGQKFDFNHLNAMQGARRAAGSDEGGKKLVAAMEAEIGYKATMEFFRKIGSGTNDDTFHEGGGPNPVTLNGAKARLAELEGDQDFVKRYLKGDTKAKQEMEALLTQIHGAAA